MGVFVINQRNSCTLCVDNLIEFTKIANKEHKITQIKVKETKVKFLRRNIQIYSSLKA